MNCQSRNRIVGLVLGGWLSATHLADAEPLTIPASVGYKDFPGQFSTHWGPGGVDMAFKRLYDYIDDYHNRPDADSSLIRPEDGAIAAYTAPGPGIKPATEMTPGQYVQAVTLNKPVPRGQPGSASAYFVLLHKHDNAFTI